MMVVGGRREGRERHQGICGERGGRRGWGRLKNESDHVFIIFYIAEL